jgi:aminoglycoside N3'-acetyltransferase/malonyl CoA-acyl carrier protein transacylase
MVGHSIGEYVAACLAGVFSLEDALALVAARGRLMGGLPEGSMLAVFLSENDIKSLLNNDLSLSAINGPSMCVVSGDNEEIDDLEKKLSAQSAQFRRLRTSHAFHSKMMEPILDDFTDQVKKITMNPPNIPFVSNLTGTWITSEDAVNPNYWAKHLRHTVRFSDCIDELLKEPHRILLEVGPGTTFSTLAKQHSSRKKEQIFLSTTCHPTTELSDIAHILNTIGQLWLVGIQVNWSGFYALENRNRLPLPTYPFERKRFWIEAGQKVSTDDSTSSSLSELIKEAHISEQAQPELKTQFVDHVPGNDVKQAVANIWKELLGYDKINYNDNFFDLGGSSIGALQLLTEIEKIFGKKLPLATFFQAPTVEQLAALLRELGLSAHSLSLEVIDPGGAGFGTINNKITKYLPAKSLPYLKQQYLKVKKQPGYLYLKEQYLKVKKQPSYLYLKREYLKARRSITKRFFSYQPSQLEEKLREIGLTDADTVYMHSAFKAFNGFSGGPQSIIDCILNVIGDSGNLLMVSMPYAGFTVDYLKAGKTFNITNTESSMGIITEIFRRKKGVLRSLNPAHPVLAFGPDAEWIISDHEKTMYSCGKGSPFEKILELNAKAIFFDVPFGKMTFFHFLEDKFKDCSPIKLYDDEPLECTVIDSNGDEMGVKTYVCSTEARVNRSVRILERELKNGKLMKTDRIGNTKLILVNLNDVVGSAQELVNAGVHFYVV